VKLGVALPQVGDWAKPDNVIKVAQKAEETGYKLRQSILLSNH